MKKCISLLLAVCLVLGLVACSSAAGDQETANAGKETTPATTEGAAPEGKGLQVGFGRANITPSYSVPLAGYGNSSMRMSQGFLDYMYATCIAITDEKDTTLLLITIDACAMYNNTVEPLQKAITEATGVPAEQILMNATHVHSGPEMSNIAEPSVQKYLVDLCQYVAQAADEAMKDRSPAIMETAKGASNNLSFVRHYTTTSGQLYSDNMSLEGEITGHHHEPDNEIQLIVFRRAAEDKKDIVAMNWQAHIKFDSTAETTEGMAGRSMLTSDGVGAFRRYVEENSDYLLAFYLGAAGNINMNSKIVSENRTTKSKEFGEYMGQDILAALETTTPTEGTTIKLTRRAHPVYVDKSENHLASNAQAVYSVWQQTNNFAEAVAADPTGSIISPYHAGSILSRGKASEAPRNLQLNAVSVGNVGFATVTYEMFDTNGKFVKDNSPFDTTFIMSMCNGSDTYIPAEYAFEGIGTYEVHNRSYPKGTAEELANQLVEMLKELT